MTAALVIDPRPERPREPRRGCDGKLRYRTRRIALQVAGRQGRLIGERLVTYRCRHCREWHIGHPGGPAGRPKPGPA